MKLQTLLQKAEDHKVLRGNTDINIAKIRFDSRDVEPKDLFVAIDGVESNGHEFISDAIEQGASAIVLENESYKPEDTSVTTIKVNNSRKALAHIAAAYYDYPARKLITIGVTGTDGKTTTSTLIHQILKEAGYRAGLITSINAIIGDKSYETGFHTTTPDALSIQKYLNEMILAGCEYAVIETSSHGLAQYRVEACEYDVAVLTNITSEHLDYHRSQAEYKQAKAHLFEMLRQSYKKENIPKVSILNKDDDSFEQFSKYFADIHLSYGMEPNADMWADDIEINQRELNFSVHSPAGEFFIKSHLLGNYNVYNILAACAVAYSQHISPKTCIKAIQAVHSIKGRMEVIPQECDQFKVIIDFAHTAHALEQALRTVRTFTLEKIHVVFGSAGFRDIKKRREMGIVAGKFADRIYLTAEDPRTEDVDVIIDEIAQGCFEQNRREGADVFRIPDRTLAIETAIMNAGEGDTVLCCGKAHETTMCYGKEEHPWSEYDAVKKALKKRGV